MNLKLGQYQLFDNKPSLYFTRWEGTGLGNLIWWELCVAWFRIRKYKKDSELSVPPKDKGNDELKNVFVEKHNLASELDGYGINKEPTYFFTRLSTKKIVRAARARTRQRSRQEKAFKSLGYALSH